MLASEVNKFELEITSNCNAECPHCVQGQKWVCPCEVIQKYLTQSKEFGQPEDDSPKAKNLNCAEYLEILIVRPQCLEICEWFGNNGGKVVDRTQRWL